MPCLFLAVVQRSSSAVVSAEVCKCTHLSDPLWADSNASQAGVLFSQAPEFFTQDTAPHAGGGGRRRSGGSTQTLPLAPPGLHPPLCPGDESRGGPDEGGRSSAPFPAALRSPPAPASGYRKTTPSQHPYLHTNNWSACIYVTIQEACQGRL